MDWLCWYTQPTRAAIVSQSPRCETSLPIARRRKVATRIGRSIRPGTSARSEPSPVVTATMSPIIPIPIRMSPTEKAFAIGKPDGSAKTSPSHARCAPPSWTFECSPASRPTASHALGETGILPPFATIARQLSAMPSESGRIARFFTFANAKTKRSA